MNRQEFNEDVLPMIKALFEMRGESAIGDAAADLWFCALRSFPPTAVDDAIKRYASIVRSADPLPMPSAIVNIIAGSPEDRALQAWHKLVAAVRSDGANRSVAFDDLTIHAVVTYLGGWIRIASTLGDNNRARVQREFMESYRLLERVGLPKNTPPHLIGNFEHSNRMNGHPHERPPTLHGDKVAAALVAAGAERAED